MSEYVTSISYVQHEGLKAHDARREFTGADVYRAVNGAGKTTILDAIRLVVLGFTLGIKKTNQDVFALARPGVDRIRLLLGGVRTDGRKVEIERRWTRGRGGAISESIRIDGQTLGTRDGEAAIRSLFPGLDDVWEPAAIFRESPAAMRARILDLVPPTEVRLEDVVPADVPKWALPKHSDLTASQWAAFAVEQTDVRINAAAADRRKEESILARLVETTETEAATDLDVTPIKARLEGLREELVRCGASKGERAAAQRAVETAASKLEAARAALGGSVRQDELAAIVEKLAGCMSPERRMAALVAPAMQRLTAQHQHSGLSDEFAHLAAEATVYASAVHALIRDAEGRERKPTNLAHLRAKLAPLRTYAPSTAAALTAARAAFREAEDRVTPVRSQLDGLRGELRAMVRSAEGEAARTNTEALGPLGKALAVWRAVPAGDREHTLGGIRETHEGNMLGASDPAMAPVIRAEYARALAATHAALALLTAAGEGADARPVVDVAARRTDLQGRIDALEIDLSIVEGERDERAAAVMAVEGGVRRVEMEREIGEVEQAIAATEQPKVPAGVTDLGAWLDGLEVTASEIVSEAIDVTAARAEVGVLEAQHGAAVKALASLPEGRARDDVEAEVLAVETELEDATAHNANAVKVREAQATLARLGASEAALKAWRVRFVEVQTGLVDKARAWFERRYSELLGGASVKVSLSSATDKPECKILVDGIEVRTMCPGHQAFALVMFLLLLSGVRRGGFRFVPIDELERIAMENREAFLRALQEAKDAGQIDQWIATGCPDSVPAIEGVTIHDMKVSIPLVPEEVEGADEAPVEPPTPKRRSRRGMDSSDFAA